MAWGRIPLFCAHDDKTRSSRSMLKSLTLGPGVQEKLDPFMGHAIVYLDGSKITAVLNNPLGVRTWDVTWRHVLSIALSALLAR